jgi:hypothetical protein
MKNYFKRTYLALVVFATSLVASVLNSMVAYVIELKSLELNSASLPLVLPPEPTVDDLWNWSYTPSRKQFTLPYVPRWVVASLKDPAKHPGFHGKVRYQSVQEESLEVTTVGQVEGHTTPIINTNVECTEVVSGHPQHVCILDVNNEPTETISGTSIPFNNIH